MPNSKISLELVLDAMQRLNTALVLYDGDHRLMFANQPAEKCWPEMIAQLRQGVPRRIALQQQFQKRHPNVAPEDIKARVEEVLSLQESSHSFEVGRPETGFLRVRHEKLNDNAYVTLGADITEVKAREGELAESNTQLRAVLDIQRAFMRHSPRHAFAQALDHLNDLTDSEYGYIGEIIHDPVDGQPFLRTHSITNIAWNAETRAFHDDHVEKGLEFRNLNTLFGVSITEKRVVIANNAPQDPMASGTPEGHPPLNAFLGVPVFVGDDMVGMFGLANRPGGYDQSVVDFLAPITETIAQLIVTTRERTAKLAARKETEAALLKADMALANLSAYQMALDQHSIVAMTDRRGRIEFVNDAFCRISGYAREELIGRDHRIVNSGHHSREFFQELWTTITSGQSWHGEVCNRSKAGDIYWVDSTIFPVPGPDGAIERFVAIRQEITQRKKFETELKDAKVQAEAANHAKSQFLANISHEIRTPLNGVNAVSDLLSRSRLDDRQTDMLNLIRSSGVMLERLLNDILDLTRIEAGRLSLTNEAFEVTDAVETACHLHQISAQEKDVAFNLTIDETARGRFISDQLRFRQIMSNLVSNAIKFTEVGQVDVRVRAQPRTDDARVDMIVEVADTGIGFDSAASDIFERFVQADSSITRSYGGTGLGLAICRSLSEIMGGSISAQSTLGVGSCFSFSIPMEVEERDAWVLDKAPSPTQELERLAEETAGGLKILCAEDHPANRRVIELILNIIGADVTMVENGREALDAVRHVVFDLVLMDMQMPGMDGLTATREIRKLEVATGRPHVKIIMVSANALEEHTQASMAAGCDAHMSKPISPDKLLSAVHVMIGQKAMIETDVAPSDHQVQETCS